VPYFKCTPCRLRVSGSGPEMDLIDGRCPSCGDRLAPVRHLTEVVGFQSFALPEPSADPGAAQAVALTLPPNS
jgi:hypothetical protein